MKKRRWFSLSPSLTSLHWWGERIGKLLVEILLKRSRTARASVAAASDILLRSEFFILLNPLSGGYWHVVLNMDLTVAVTQNFCSTTNFRMVWPRVVRSRPKMSKKFFERLQRRRPDLARLAEQIDPNSDTGPHSDSSSSSSSSSSEDSSEDSPDESDDESTASQKKKSCSFEQGDEQSAKKQRVSQTNWKSKGKKRRPRVFLIGSIFSLVDI